MKRLLVYSKKYWIQMIAAAISSVTASISTVMVIDILREIIDIISKGNMMQEIWYIILKVIIVICVGIVSNYMLVAMTGFVGAGLLKDFRNDAVNSLINASPEYINQCNYGDLMERMTEDIEGLAGFMSGYFKDCLYVPILTVVYSVYLISMNAPLAMICLFPLAIIVPLNVKLLKPIKLRQSQYVKELGLTNNNVDEAFAGAEIIKSYNIQEKMMNRYEDTLYKTFKTSNETDLAQYNLEPISRAIQEVPMALAICVGGVLVFRNAITMGVLIAYISIIKKLIEPLSGCYQLVVRSQTALVSVSRVFDVIDIMPEEELSAGMKSDEMITDFPLISFNDVTFGYGDEKVLINVSFDVKKGEILGVAGLVGAGRTELMETIFGVRTRAAGRVYFNNHLMNFESAKDAMEHGFAMITEERKANGLFLKGDLTFNTTIANLKQYKSGIALSDSKMEKATAEEIKTMRTKCMGPNDMISNLSGGNQQKVIFGKWLEREPQVFMMDEPTRGIDVGAKYEIYELIINMAKQGRTIIVVSSEMPEILGITNRIGVMSNGYLSGIVNTKETNQEELLRLSAKYL